jgi:hypothetical protein
VTESAVVGDIVTLVTLDIQRETMILCRKRSYNKLLEAREIAIVIALDMRLCLGKFGAKKPMPNDIALMCQLTA